MKKRWLALLCAAAVAVTVWFNLAPAARAVSYEGAYLVGVNDTVMLGLINKERMPVLRSGAIYAPYTVLDNRDLGLSYALNKTDGTFTIYTRRKSLIFYTTGSGASDKEGNEYPNRMFTRNGTVYIPLRFVASFFNLRYSYYNINLPDGTVPLIRLCSEDAMLDDQQFGAQAAQLAAQPLSQYMASQATPTPTSTATPRPSPSPTPTPSEEPPEPVTAYLAFACTDGGGFGELLTLLGDARLSALFLFSPGELAQRERDVRAAAAAGHQIGLILPEEEPLAAFEEGNELLRHILRSDAVQVTFADGSVPEGPWTVWTGNVALRGRTSAARAQNLIADMSRLETARVTLDDSVTTVQVMPAVLPTLLREPFTLKVATETDPFVE